MKFNKTLIYYISIFLFFYFTLIIGFLYGEDSSGGAVYDFNIHLKTINFFSDSILNGLKNYNKYQNAHSPIFIIFLKYILSHSEIIGRFFYLNICVLVPLIFFKSIVQKAKVNLIFAFYLSQFFFLSPYFRSSAIWPGDENLAILFFLLSVYFYIKFFNTISEKEKTKYMIYNIVLLAIAAYWRPIYSLFSIFFFFEFILQKFKLKNLLLYLLLSIIFSLPALYYVFILKINFFNSYIENYNLINSLALMYTVLLYYLVPFIFFSFKDIKVNYLNVFFTILFSLVIFKFFSYETTTGGGIFFRVQNILYKDNFFFTIIFALSFFLCNQILEINKIKNLIIIGILLFFEIDTHFYQETYDPLFLICVFLLFDIKIVKNFFNDQILKKINFLFIYLIGFWLSKVIYLYYI